MSQVAARWKSGQNEPARDVPSDSQSRALQEHADTLGSFISGTMKAKQQTIYRTHPTSSPGLCTCGTAT